MRTGEISARQVSWVFGNAGYDALVRNLKEYFEKGGNRQKAFDALNESVLKEKTVDEVAEEFEEYCYECDAMGKVNRKTGESFCPVCDW